MHIQCTESKKDFITALSVPTTGTEEVKEGKFSGKHYDHMLFIVDEGDTVPGVQARSRSSGLTRMMVQSALPGS